MSKLDSYSASDNDRHIPGKSIQIIHILTIAPEADLGNLTGLSKDELEKKRKQSIKRERKTYRELCYFAQLWEYEAADTLMIDKALEIVVNRADPEPSKKLQSEHER